MAQSSIPSSTMIEPPAEQEPTQEQIEAAVARGSEAAPSEGEGEPRGWLDILQADTPPSEIRHRAVYARGAPVANPDGTPKTLAYVTARYVQDRLDAAVGPENWQNYYEGPMASGAVRCGISIRLPDTDTWITKWDVGVPSSIEPDKGAHSDAFKRAAVLWGIARDLYDERDESAPSVEQQQGQGNGAVSPLKTQPTLQQTVQQQPMAQQANPYVQVVEQPMQQPQAGMPLWVCPLHNDVQIIPGGISKKTGKPYSAFYACPVSGCDNTGGNIRPPQ